MSTAASTWSATRWNVVVHSSRKSAPAALDPARRVGEQLADLVPAFGLLEVGELGEVHRAQHQPAASDRPPRRSRTPRLRSR